MLIAMPKVTLLLFSDDRRAIERVKNTVILILKRELDHKAKAGEIKYSDEHQNFYCYVNAEVGIELGSTIIPSETPAKPSIVLREVREDDRT
jgi:hypothetical protein